MDQRAKDHILENAIPKNVLLDWTWLFELLHPELVDLHDRTDAELVDPTFGLVDAQNTFPILVIILGSNVLLENLLFVFLWIFLPKVKLRLLFNGDRILKIGQEALENFAGKIVNMINKRYVLSRFFSLLVLDLALHIPGNYRQVFLQQRED